ncbi:MAG TPA: hypothetical protein VF363_01775, partial [Candidatus Eisenbacteria bacterium]
MTQRMRVLTTALAMTSLLAMAGPASAGVPDLTQSFYVPQVGSVATPTEGTNAIKLFRGCPNN